MGGLIVSGLLKHTFLSTLVPLLDLGLWSQLVRKASTDERCTDNEFVQLMMQK